MTTTQIAEIVCAHSPDSGDAYLFYALATRRIRSSVLELRHRLEDIATLNQKALQGEYEVTALSYHAYAHAGASYSLIRHGGCIGDGFGPCLVADRPLAPADLKGRRIAVPGKLTTGYLVLRLMQPDFIAVSVPHDKVFDAVRDGAADAALLIHEAASSPDRFRYHTIADLGRWWKDTRGLPLPLAANAVRRDLEPEIRREASKLVRESIRYAFEHREEALNYALQFAPDLDNSSAEKSVSLYVNQYTAEGGDAVSEAAQTLLDQGFEAGFLPRRVIVEYTS